MCYEVPCSKCGKTTWDGCGWHVKSVYNAIPEGQRCECKPWPGVKPVGDKTANSADIADESIATKIMSYCTIM